MNNRKGTAAWRGELTDAEREALAKAERERDEKAEVLRELLATLKARCIKRLHRKGGRQKGGG